MVNKNLLELVNKLLIVAGMNSLSLHAGRRARQLAPSLAAQAIAVAATQPGLTSEDLRLFLTTLCGGLVFFGTFFS